MRSYSSHFTGSLSNLHSGSSNSGVAETTGIGAWLSGFSAEKSGVTSSNDRFCAPMDVSCALAGGERRMCTAPCSCACSAPICIRLLALPAPATACPQWQGWHLLVFFEIHTHTHTYPRVAKCNCQLRALSSVNDPGLGPIQRSSKLVLTLVRLPALGSLHSDSNPPNLVLFRRFEERPLRVHQVLLHGGS